MRKYKMALCLAIAAFMAGFTFFTDFSSQSKILFCLIGLVAIVYLSRGNSVYAKATKYIAKRDPEELEKGIKLMEKALDLGCSENYTVIAATLLLQHGDIEKAKINLEEKANSSTKSIKNSAKASLGMYYYMKGDVNKAIELSEEAKGDRTRNANLYANLCLYYLAANDKQNYRRTLSEAFSHNATSLALIDIQAISFILQNEYKKAGITLEKLFSQTKPSYPDPYLHYAMVYLKYGHVSDAIKMLKDSLSTSFSNTSQLKKDEIEAIIAGLENPKERLKWVDAYNSDKTLALKRYLPRIRNVEVEECTDDIIPGFPELPNFSDDSDIEKLKKELRDPEDIDTSLNEDDEKWLERHKEED